MGDVIGRWSELQELSRAWQRARGSEPQLYVLWGRRRVGKTYLLTHFAEGKRCLYFTATRQDSERRQVDRYAAAVRDQLGEEVADLAGGGRTDWEAALRSPSGSPRSSSRCWSSWTRCHAYWPGDQTLRTSCRRCGSPGQPGRASCWL